MRSKEDAQDYRYFPDPDLPPVEISDAWLEEIRRLSAGTASRAKERAMPEEFKLPAYDASILTETKKLADLFEETVALGAKPKEVSNWLMVEAMRLLKEREMDAEEMGFSPAHLAALIQMVEKGAIEPHGGEIRV